MAIGCQLFLTKRRNIILINLDQLSETEKAELMRQMLNAYNRERYKNRTEEQKERERKRKREYAREYRKQNREHVNAYMREYLKRRKMNNSN